MISTSVPTVPVVPHIPFVLKIPAVLSVSFVSDVSRELICTGRTSCTLGTDDTLDTFGVKNRLLRYGRDIRCQKQPSLVRDAFADAFCPAETF